MASILLFAIGHKKINTPILLLWVLFVMALGVALFSELPAFETVKNVLNYLSTPLICLAAYNVYIKTGLKLSFGLFLGVVLIYFFVAFMQMYYDPGFMTFVLNQGARGVMLGGRGVVSLCPEPAFYGSLCIFFMVFSFIQYSFRQNLVLIPLLVFQLFFFAQSATSIIVFIVAALLYVVLQLARFRLSYVIYTAALLSCSWLVYNTQKTELESSRAAVLLEELARNPAMIAQVDVSAGVRITSTISPYLSARHNGLLPMGWGTYKSFVSRLNQSGDYPKLLNRYIVNEIGRLGGGINMVLFHLGFLGLLFPLAIWLSFRPMLSRNAVLFGFILLILILFTQIQLMQSMIGLILATAIYYGKQEHQTDTERLGTI